MSVDLAALRQAVTRHGRVARVVVADVRGSAPREPGAAMLVWADGQSGTIGGGALEFQASSDARRALTTGKARVTRHPLGPALGQCCGGAVTLVTEVLDAAALATLDGPTWLRRVEGTGDVPLPLRRAAAAARNAGLPAAVRLHSGWLIEPVAGPRRPVWIYGAGHVGAAIAGVLSPLPEIDVTLIDTDRRRFADVMPTRCAMLVSANPADAVAHAPDHAEHLILTYSHAFDLEICHRLLQRGFAFAGLIGSDTKWARFRSRLRDLGHSDAQISRIRCPIGQKSLGKHPQAIAIGVATDLLSPAARAYGVEVQG